MIEINVFTQHDMRQDIVASVDDEDSTDLERMYLDTHVSMVVLGRIYYVVNNAGNMSEVHLFSPEY